MNKSLLNFFLSIGLPLLLSACSASGLFGVKLAPVGAALGKRLVFGLSGPLVVAGACTPGSVQSYDGPNPVDESSGLSVALTLASGNGKLFSDPLCQSPLNSAAMLPGTHSANFYFLDPTAEMVTLYAAAPTRPTASLALVLQPALPDRLAIKNGPQVLLAGSCSPYDIQAKDKYGNDSPVASNTTITLAGFGNGGFYSDPSCGTPITSVNIVAGASAARVYFQDPATESVTLTASTSTGLGPGSFGVNIVVNGGGGLIFTAGASLLSIGTCALYTVTTVNPATQAPAVVAGTLALLLTGGGTGSFYSDPQCTKSSVTAMVPASQSSASFYFKAPSAQSLTLLVSGQGYGSTVLGVSVVNGTTAPVAGGGSGGGGVGPPPNPTAFTASPSGISQIHLSWTSGGGTTAGYLLAYLAGPVAPVNCIGGQLVGSLTAYDVTGLNPTTQYSFRLCANDLSVPALLSSGVTASATTATPPSDPSGLNATASSGSKITLAWTAGSGATGYLLAYKAGITAPVNCNGGTDVGNVTARTVTGLSSDTKYSFRLCSYDSLPTPDVSTGVTVSGGTVSTSLSTASASPPTVTADGSTSSTITVTLKDALGNAISGQAMTLSSGRGANDTISPATGTTNGSGQTTFTVKSTLAGTPALTATETVDSLNVAGTTASFVAGAVSAAQSTVAANATGVTADGIATSTITVTLLDAHNNPVSGKSVSLASSRGSTDTIIPALGTTNNSGQATFTVSSTAAGSTTLSATDTSDSNLAVTQTTSVSFNAGAVSAAKSTIVASPTTVSADGTTASTITVTLLDANLNPLSGKTVKLTAGSGNSGISPASATTNGSGQVSFSVTDSTVETVAYTGKDTTDNVTVIPTASVTFVPLQGKLVASVDNYTTCAVSATGNVFCWGSNSYGQLGNNSTTASFVPVEVAGVGSSGFLSGITSLAAGQYHTCALSSSGTVYCWGYNYYGQLGNNAVANSSVPVQVVGIGGTGLLSGVTALVAGYNHTCALSSGHVYCWGYNYYGQLGNNSTTSSSTPVEVLGLSGLGFLSSATGLGAGSNHNCAVSLGNVYCWGDNVSGDLGNNSTVQSNTPVQVLGVGGLGVLSGVTSLGAASATSTCALSSGSVYCWGANTYGQLGNNSSNEAHTPVQVVGVGGSGFLSGITSLTGSSYQTCGVSSTNNVYCWGYDYYGGLGNNSSTQSLTPVEAVGVGGTGLLSGITSIAVGAFYACGLSAMGDVYCWGYNYTGNLGNNSSTASYVPVLAQAVGLGNGTSFFSTYVLTPNVLTAGNSGNFGCAVSLAGGVYCFGQNTNGQLGNGTATDSQTPVQVVGVGGTGFLSNILSAGAGASHACALSLAGSAYCWGSNASGQLGNNTTTNSSSPVQVVGAGGSGLLANVVLLTAGTSHTCALTSGGSAYCWGDNSHGQLGNNSTTASSTPVQVKGVGGTGVLTNILSLTAGDYSTCALTGSGNAYCWGSNSSGQLGNASLTDSSTPVTVVATSGTGSLSNLLGLTAGTDHACAFDKTGYVYCWGFNQFGQLGNGSTTYSPIPVNVWSTGGYAGSQISGIVGLAAGSSHTCAQSSTGTVYCWGDNQYGQLGNNSTSNYYYPVTVGALGSSSPLRITAGKLHSCASTVSGNVYCWGYNGNGQLGINSMSLAITPTEVVGVGGTGFLSGI